MTKWSIPSRLFASPVRTWRAAKRNWHRSSIRRSHSQAQKSSSTAFDGAYPGWQPNFKSTLLATMKETYEKEFGTSPRIVTIHAGLECGIIGSKYDGMEMISFGPTIEHPHSPDERVNIATVQKFYRYVLAALKAL